MLAQEPFIYPQFIEKAIGRMREKLADLPAGVPLRFHFRIGRIEHVRTRRAKEEKGNPFPYVAIAILADERSEVRKPLELLDARLFHDLANRRIDELIVGFLHLPLRERPHRFCATVVPGVWMFRDKGDTLWTEDDAAGAFDQLGHGPILPWNHPKAMANGSRKCYNTRMPDYASLIAQYQGKDLPIEEQKKMGQATAAKMDAKHEDFVKHVLDLLTRKEIDPWNPESIIKQDVYDKLPDEWRVKVDLALPNIADQLRMIVDFRLSKETPDESPILAEMIDYLWQMKEKIEAHHDVFKL